MAARDLAYFATRLTGLRVTCDTSHAQLYLNALRYDGEAPPEFAGIVEFTQGHGDDESLESYIRRLGPHLFEAHISNAEGLLGEGLPYAKGDIDLDSVVAQLLPVAQFLVTEPIERDPDKGLLMRETERFLLDARQRLASGGHRQ